ncbi:MAG: porin [Pseudomonadales bacterium]|nr:porin [Pseudomonadales bacterium]
MNNEMKPFGLARKPLVHSMAVLGLCGISASTHAAEWDVKFGGYYNAIAAYASSDPADVSGTDFDGVDVNTDGEVFFLPSITLDNGIKISANIQLEAESGGSGDRIDEAFIHVNGSFGTVEVGSTNSAGYKMHYGAPDLALLSGDDPSSIAYVSEYIPFDGSISDGATSARYGDDVFRATLGSTHLETNANNDAQRITYFTPRFAGFQLGVSYARDGDEDNRVRDCNFGDCKYFDVAANYVQSFGDIDLGVSGRWGIAESGETFGNPATGDDPTVTGFGINLGFAGVTVGGSWAEQNDSGASDGEAYDVGVSYDSGPWQYSFTYFEGENVDNEHAFVSDQHDEELSAFLISANYQIHENIKLNLFGAYLDFDEDIGDAGVGSRGNGLDGFVIGTGIGLSF